MHLLHHHSEISLGREYDPGKGDSLRFVVEPGGNGGSALPVGQQHQHTVLVNLVGDRYLDTSLLSCHCCFQVPYT